jgi:hypothetical protein
MSTRPRGTSDPATTEVELPPGIDAPAPPPVRDRAAAGSDPPANVERELRRCAGRVGGWDRLRELVDRLAASG